MLYATIRALGSLRSVAPFGYAQGKLYERLPQYYSLHMTIGEFRTNTNIFLTQVRGPNIQAILMLRLRLNNHESQLLTG